MVVTEGAGLVVTHTSAFGARLAAEKRGLPWVSAALAPFAFMSAYDPPVLGVVAGLTEAWLQVGATAAGGAAGIVRVATAGWTAPFRQLRRELGLGRAPGNPLFEGQFSPHGTVALYSRVLGELQPDFPARTTICGFTFYDREKGAAEECRPIWRGSSPTGRRRWSSPSAPPWSSIRATSIATACAGLEPQAPRRVPGRPTATCCPSACPRACSPSATRRIRWSSRAPRPIVHQGGVGTTAQALRAGRAAADRPRRWRPAGQRTRITRLGVGRTMQRAEYDPVHGAHDVGLLLRRGAYRRAPQELASRIALEDGASNAADILESALHAGRALRRAG